MSLSSKEILQPNRVQKPSVLLVCGNLELKDVILDTLRDSYRVKLVENFSLATDVLTENSFNIIVIDTSLSISKSFWFSKWLKSNVLLDHIPVLAFSQDLSEEAQVDAAAAQVDAFLTGERLNIVLFSLVLKNLLDATEKQRLWYSKNYLKETHQLSTGKKDEAFLISLTRIVNANIDNSDLDVNFVCREMGISRTNLYNKVKTVTGMSMAVFIRENRLNMAARLLTDQDMQANEVMSMVGIQSHSYFSKAFKKKFGVSPSSFGNHK